MYGGGFDAGAAYTLCLPAGEGDLINKVFTAVGAGGFPGDEDVGGNQAANGGGGVAQHGGGFLHGDTFWCGDFGLICNGFHV